MSPELTPAARGAGQKLTREAAQSKPKKWRCDICQASGTEPTAKSATRAWDRHYYTRHSKDGES